MKARVAALFVIIVMAITACVFGPPAEQSSPVSASAASAPTSKVPLKTGNLGIADLAEAKAKGRALPGHQDLEPLKFLARQGVSSIEDYVPWHWVEPQKGVFDWKRSDHHYAGVAAAGMTYAVYPMVHLVPDWVVNESGFQGFVCVEHGKATTFPSLWAPATLTYYEQYYRRLKEHFGAKIGRFYVAGPADFGEIGYPAGAADGLWKTPHMHEGWWANDPFARKSYAEYLRAKYGSVASLNARWRTAHGSFEAIPYPTSPQNRLHWLDFVTWYRSSLTDFTVKLVTAAKANFPSIPMEIKLGHPYEKLVYGTDIAGLVKAAARHKFAIRSTHAAVPAQVFKKISRLSPEHVFFFASRYSTLTDFYKVPFVTEEVSGLPKERSLPRIFVDASIGVSEVFLGPPSFMNARDLYQQHGALLQGTRGATRIAFYYPLTDHLLKPDELLPPAVFDAANVLRDVMNYDIADDQAIEDGILERYRFLAIFDRAVMKASVLQRIRQWVGKGGVLIHPAANEKLDVLEGSAANDERELFSFGTEERRSFLDGEVFARKVESGGVIAIQPPRSPSDFYHVVVKALYQGATLFPGARVEPVIDVQMDEVFTTAFKDRIVFFNASRQRKTKTFELDPADFPVLKAKRGFSVTLQPRSIHEVAIKD